MTEHAMQGKSPNTSEPPAFNLGRFIFLATGWMTAGTFVGVMLADSADVAPESWVPWIVGFYFVVIGALTGISVRSTLRKIRKLAEPTSPESLSGERVLARVGKLEEAGITLSSVNHMFIFTLTVFPTHGSPYETTIRQFITMGELPNFHTGRFVVFIEDPQNPGYGQIDKDPPEEWQLKAQEPPPELKTVKATRSWPDRKANADILGEEIPKRPPLEWALRITAMLSFFAIGIMLPFLIMPGGKAALRSFFGMG